MRFTSLVLAMMVVSSCKTGAGQNAPEEPRPADFRVEYRWWEGSIPPPHHYEYTIAIGSKGESEIVMTPDYPGDAVPRWVEHFAVPPERLDSLYRSLVDNGLFAKEWKRDDRGRVGGSRQELVVTARGKQITVESFPDSPQEASAEILWAAVNDTVPKEIRDRLEGMRQQYMREHEQPPRSN